MYFFICLWKVLLKTVSKGTYYLNELFVIPKYILESCTIKSALDQHYTDDILIIWTEHLDSLIDFHHRFKLLSPFDQTFSEILLR